MLLSQIESPKDLQGLDISQLTVLSQEIRDFLIHSISQTGGHLASNLGVVELTLALHAVFDVPLDKIIWDVGHQSYIHKILTGRAKDFNTLRKLDGLSGFPKSKESPCDAFDTGHSSTAISAALGFCAARDLQGGSHSVIAVVGDGSMTGGLVYEGLNNAGRSNTDLLVVLNDNQMSISKNVGAVSRHLSDIRSAPFYTRAKRDVRKFLTGLPFLAKWIEKTKDTIKFMLIPGVLFEELGFQYFGPVDGHDLEALIRMLQKLRKIKGPVLLHVVTKKGKGFSHAEKSPWDYHGVESFDPNTGEPNTVSAGTSYTDVFSEALLGLAEHQSNLVAVTAAMSDNTGLNGFQKTYPKRFYDVGIAEAHAVTFAAGMAKAGAIPVVAVYSSFLQRAYDQILHDVCVQNLHVIFAVDRAGLVGPDGETHQGLFDLSFLAHMPNMTIMAPKNKTELSDMLKYGVMEHNGPVAIRYPRGVATNVLSDKRTTILLGCAETIEKGENIAIVSVGSMIEIALLAVESLKNQGYKPSLYNARFVKPLDYKLAKQLQDYSYVFILEDNVYTGGYGERLWALMGNENSTTLPFFKVFAFPDKFIEHGSREELFKRYALDSTGVVAKMLENLKGVEKLE